MKEGPLPILYSFRRCPYAIRARMALLAHGHALSLREVVLRNKPAAMIAISPKATVPVLVLPSGGLIDESRAIMNWAAKNALAPAKWIAEPNLQNEFAKALVEQNDGEFKLHLDRYKYADRYPEKNPADYRKQAEVFIQRLEKKLSQNPFLDGDAPSHTDLAIFPFVRQFAMVDIDWFNTQAYPNTQRWLSYWLSHDLFLASMKKYSAWQEGEPGVVFS